MKLANCSLFIILILLPRIAAADGFKLRLIDNKIVGQNTEGIVPAQLFGRNLEANSVEGIYESDHGSVDANDSGSGFSFPFGGPNDEFSFHIRSFWTSDGVLATPAGPGVELELLKASNSEVLASIKGSSFSPASFDITATSTHELLWSLPNTTSAQALGLVFTIRGTSVVTGLPFEESDPFVVVQWTPDFTGDPDAAMRTIYAAAVPEPDNLCLVVCAVTGLATVLRSLRMPE